MPRLTADQLASRRQGLGSSDIPELLGLAPWENASPLRLFAEKRGMLPDDGNDESLEQRVGHALEPALIQLYESESGFRVVPQTETVVHRVHPWARATIDGRIVDKSAALEIKVVGIGMARGWDLRADDGIPHYVRSQVAWQMAVEELDEVHVAALVLGTQFRVFYVQRDHELEAAIWKQAAAFWDRVQNNQPPDLDATDTTKKYLAAKYPAAPPDVSVEATGDIVGVGVRRAGQAESARAAEDDKVLCDARIMQAMGEAGASEMWCKEWRATWRQAKSGKRTYRFTPRAAT